MINMEKPKNSEKSLLHCHFAQGESHLKSPGTEPDHRAASCRLIYGPRTSMTLMAVRISARHLLNYQLKYSLTIVMPCYFTLYLRWQQQVLVGCPPQHKFEDTIT